MAVVDLDAVVIVWPKYDHRTIRTCALVDIDSSAECFKKIQFALFNGAVFSLPPNRSEYREGTTLDLSTSEGVTKENKPCCRLTVVEKLIYMSLN